MKQLQLKIPQRDWDHLKQRLTTMIPERAMVILIAMLAAPLRLVLQLPTREWQRLKHAMSMMIPTPAMAAMITMIAMPQSYSQSVYEIIEGQLLKCGDIITSAADNQATEEIMTALLTFQSFLHPFSPSLQAACASGVASLRQCLAKEWMKVLHCLRPWGCQECVFMRMHRNIRDVIVTLTIQTMQYPHDSRDEFLLRIREMMDVVGIKLDNDLRAKFLLAYHKVPRDHRRAAFHHRRATASTP